MAKAPMKNSTMCHRLGNCVGLHAGEAHRPPARHQQQPGADRPVEAGEPQIGAGDRGRETVDPVAGRIGDASGALAHLPPSGVPVRVSKVPRPVLMLLASGIGALSASLRLGAAGRGGRAAAAWQTLVRISGRLGVPLLHVVDDLRRNAAPGRLSTAYLIILASAAVKR